MTFFERFEELSKIHNTSPNAVAKELGISSGSVTAWKNSTSPSIDKAILIAGYFNVTTDYLLGVEQKENPASGEAYENAAEMSRLLQRLPEDKQQAVLDFVRFQLQEHERNR
jgi:transcriptional regulator with XRE-family HTH domain